MKYLVLIVFVMILMCKCGHGLKTNTTNELEEAFDKLAAKMADVWRDFKKITAQDDNYNATETGRGKKTQKMAIPLMIGFKMAGVVIAALTALKFLLLQSLVLSKFALAAALVLSLKIVFDHMHGHLYKVTDISHISSAAPYSYPSHLGLESSQYEAVADPGSVGYAYYTPTAETNADDVQQGHYFSGIFQTAQAKNSSRSATERFYNVASKRPNSKVVKTKTIIRKTTNVE